MHEGWNQVQHLLLGYLCDNPACHSPRLEVVIFSGSLGLQLPGGKAPAEQYHFSAFEVQNRLSTSSRYIMFSERAFVSPCLAPGY